MKIGLVDVDGHNFPNLSLMKLSAYHKDKGDNVDWANSLETYDRIYMARVFDDTYTQDDMQCYQAAEIIRGGTGYSLKDTLESLTGVREIENIYPDYALYGIKDTAYGFLTRGCPRQCPFCIVSAKEGRCSVKVADLNSFWRRQETIKLLDPNILACKEYPYLLDQLAASGAWVDFTQGLDIRLMAESAAAQISSIKIKMLHFAWDNADDKATLDKLNEFAGAFKLAKGNKPTVYVLTNFNSTHEQDLFRIYALREMGYDPYVMIYNKPNAPQVTRYLQRWTNNKRIFRVVERFEDYDNRKG